MDRYAASFNFTKYVRLQQEVLSVIPASDYEESGRWKVTSKSVQSGKVECEVFDAVHVCTGHHGYKSIPDSLPGQDNFRGRIIHAHDIKSCESFRDQRVLIVGLGNSGCDLAVECASIAKQVPLVVELSSNCKVTD